MKTMEHNKKADYQLVKEKWNAVLEALSENSSVKLLLRQVNEYLADLKGKKYIETHPQLLKKCDELQKNLHQIQLDLSEIGKVLDEELWNTAKNMSSEHEVFLIDINKAYIVDEKEDSICFTLPCLVPERKEITIPTFWLNKASVKDAAYEDYYQLRIDKGKEITAYEYDEKKKRKGKVKISADSLIDTIMAANESLRITEQINIKSLIKK